jgi:hypothetical protein
MHDSREAAVSPVKYTLPLTAVNQKFSCMALEWMSHWAKVDPLASKRVSSVLE